ncbi:MAG TPA: TAXI family TRAP transporter solute-binding subunit [Vicinamibacterales bacterium]|jgi:hypothetical protein|nr:TAXI family TRAP transporter solute-binding subunit [Vicinamibacterales bacterium]
MKTRWVLAIVVLGVAFAPFGHAGAQSTQAYGIAAKRPVFAGACHYCPWGAIADVVKAAMKPYDYDVQICYVCATTFGPRQVAGALVPQPRADVAAARPAGLVIMGPDEPVPKGPVDFGATSTPNLRRAYEGRGDYEKEGPRKNLRVFAIVDYPAYLLVAATKESGITDLAQLKGRKTPLRVLVDNQPESREVLAYYGHTEDSIKAAGGTVRRGGPQVTTDFDLVVFGGTLSNAPEQAVWYTLTQKYDLLFLQLPDDLILQLAKDPDYERRTAPLGLLRGLDRNIPTVARHMNAVFGRADAPEAFAYTVAKALDEQQDLWTWAPIPLYYNPRTAWKTNGLPLHPGAVRYYREKGYMK